MLVLSCLSIPVDDRVCLAQGNIMKDSFFSYTNAVYAAGEGIKHTILDNVESASIRVCWWAMLMGSPSADAD
jgi:hypothetical protein